MLADGKIYPTADRTAAIPLDTNNRDWVFSPLPVNRQKLKWSDVEFPDQNWQIPQQQGINESTYSRVSRRLWDQLLSGQWITGRANDSGEIFLQKQWVIPKSPAKAVVRVSGTGYYSILVNDRLVHQNSVIEADQLNLYEVTRLLHPGINTVSARLLRPLVSGGVSADGPLAVYLDGWTEDSQGEVRGAIATDTTWQAASLASNNTVTLEPASLVKRPIPHQLQRAYWGDASRFQIGRYLQQQMLWMGGGILMVVSIAWGLGFSLQRFNLQEVDSKPSIAAATTLPLGTAALAPGLFFLTIVGLLKHRYAEAERGIFFAQASIDWLILSVFLSITVVSCLWICRPQRGWPHRWQRWGMAFLTGWLLCTGLGIVLKSYLPTLLIIGSGVIFWLRHVSHVRLWQSIIGQHTACMRNWLQGLWPSWLVKWYRHYYWLLGLILLVGFCFRAYQIGFNDLEPDENVSYDAVRGILRTGAPISTSKIWYTRGPFFHYPLAIWLKIVGLSPENARMWSVLWGVATLVMVFVFTRLITGKVWIALVATAILAIDPWELMFYT